jgi:hypothetical protein
MDNQEGVQEMIDDLRSVPDSKLSREGCLELADYIDELQNENRKLKAFHDYFSELYGQGLEIAYWHGNGDLEPFDNFFESAKEEME